MSQQDVKQIANESDPSASQDVQSPALPFKVSISKVDPIVKIPVGVNGSKEYLVCRYLSRSSMRDIGKHSVVKEFDQKSRGYKDQFDVGMADTESLKKSFIGFEGVTLSTLRDLLEPLVHIEGTEEEMKRLVPTEGESGKAVRRLFISYCKLSIRNLIARAVGEDYEEFVRAEKAEEAKNS